MLRLPAADRGQGDTGPNVEHRKPSTRFSRVHQVMGHRGGNANATWCQYSRHGDTKIGGILISFLFFDFFVGFLRRFLGKDFENVVM